MQALYFRAEREDDYHRDGCVFSPQVDIEDTVNATVRYAGGALMSYSLVTYAAYEGWHISLTGTHGRLEAGEVRSGPESEHQSQTIRLFRSDPRIGSYIIDEIEVPKAVGEHGGADERMRTHLFAGNPPADPLGYRADSWAEAMSMLVGVAANQSMITGRSVTLEELLDAPASGQ